MKSTFYSLGLLFSCLLFLTPTSSDSSSEKWDFKKEKEGIQIFTRTPEGRDLKELKILLTLDGANLTTIAAALKDVPKMEDWVYKCSKAQNLEQVTPQESIEYYQVDFPWPMTDRDLVVKSKIYQDPETGNLHSVTTSYNDFKPLNDKFIRITEHRNEWIFEPTSEDQVKVTYYLSSNPAGSIPDWLVNMVVDQGPVQSMRAFRKLLQEDTYRNAQIAGIKNY